METVYLVNVEIRELILSSNGLAKEGENRFSCFKSTKRIQDVYNILVDIGKSFDEISFNSQYK